MASLTDYASSAFYDLKQNFTGQDFVLGKDIEAWVQELDYGVSKPRVYSMEVVGTAPAAEATTIELESNVAGVKLYRRDVLRFASRLVVIAEDVTVGTSATDVKVLPLTGPLAIGAIAKTYAMIPILSMAEGGFPEVSGTDAEAMNKEQGLYVARRTVKRDGSVTISGALLRSDPSLKLLFDIGRGSQNLFYQARYAPFTTLSGTDYTEGAGPGAYEVVVSLTNASYASAGQEFVQVNYTMNFSGRPDEYKPLPETVPVTPP
jgi:hypothetical protein